MLWSFKNFNKNYLFLVFIVKIKKLYSKFFTNAIYLSDDNNQILSRIIEEIKKTSKLSIKSDQQFTSIIKNMKRKVDSIILACSELPIVVNQPQISGLEVINPNKIYAKEVIYFAKK